MSDGIWWHRTDTSDGLRLRAPTTADAAGVLGVHGDPRVYTLDPHEAHVDLAHSARFLEPILTHWATHGFGYWVVLGPEEWHPTGVESAADDQARGAAHQLVHLGLGGVQRYEIDGQPVLNVYFRLAPEVQGRGIAGTIVDHCVLLAPIVAPGVDLVVRTRPANTAARRVATRAGFRDEGLEPGTTDMQLLRLSAPAAHRASPAPSRHHGMESSS